MKTATFYVIAHISILSVLIPIIFSFGKASRAPKQNKLILAMLILGAIADGINFALARQKMSTALTINLYDICSFTFLNLFYFEIFYRKRLGYMMMLGILIYIAIIIYTTATIGLTSFQLYLWASGSAILGIHAILYVVNIPRMPLERLLDKNLYSNLIINSALAFYFFTSLFIFAFSTYVFTQTTPDTSRLFWSFHNIANVLKNIGIAIGFYFTGKRSVYITLEQLEVLGRKQDATADF